MSTPTPPTNLRHLKWQNQCGFEVANDGTCLYMRETAGSIVAGFIFGTVISLVSIVCGGWMIFKEPGNDAKGFGSFLVLLGAFFGFLVVWSLRRGRWMITYDRGAGEIRYRGQTLSVSHVRCISTRACGGSMPRYTVSAELHNGKYDSLGPIGVSTWPAHWAKQAADWMGLPFQHLSG